VAHQLAHPKPPGALEDPLANLKALA
jgi:hypothetical protein